MDPHCRARLSTFCTPHGPVEMPAFMPVGTQATVKGLSIDAVRETGAKWSWPIPIIFVTPGAEVVQALGGLHAFSGWPGPMLTDSGGFQIFSLARNTKITEEQAVFRSHWDGRLFELSPEGAVAIQEALGADVAMVLDHVVALPCSADRILDATRAYGALGRCACRRAVPRRPGPVRDRSRRARSAVARGTARGNWAKLISRGLPSEG